VQKQSEKNNAPGPNMVIPFSWLDNFPLPLLLIDASLNVIHRNNSAMTLIGDTLNNDVMLSPDTAIGSYLDCHIFHSTSSRRCNVDERCQGCEIRSAIEATFQTRVPRFNLEVLNGPSGMISPQPVTCSTFFVDAPNGPYVMIALGNETKVQRLLNIILLLESDGLAVHLAESVFEDIATPLTYTVANLELISEQLSKIRSQVNTELSAALEAPIEDALMGIRAMKKSAELYGLTRQSRQKTLSRYRLSELVDVAIKMLPADVADIATIRFSRDDTVWINAISRETIHAIFELIQNALESFSRNESQKNRIDVEVTSSSHVATLCIRDNGSGISESELSRLFEPGYSTKKPTAGFGFGLIYCRNIISAIGGELQLESKEGEGTTVKVSLTRAAAPSPDSEPPALPDYPLTMKKHAILFVDSEIMLRRLAKRVLSEFDVSTCPPTGDALRMSLQRQTYDLIICDKCQKTNAHMLLQDALNAVNATDIPVIYMTSPSGGLLPAVETQHSREFEIAKPFDLQQLREMVYQSLQTSQSGAMTTVPISVPPYEK
jgi:two-component sensor histidine kinase/CheY-like chemotaxis protein